MKKFIFSLFLFAFVVAPALAFATTSSYVPGDVDPNPGVSECVSLMNNLRYRDRDATKNGEVSTLQDFLQAKGYLNNEPTGYFGLLTLKAVKDFQKDKGISPTGYMGPLTRAKIKALCGDSEEAPTPSSSFKVYSPAKGAVWMVGNSYTIKWDVNPTMGMVAETVSIDLTFPRPACLDAYPACAVKMMAPYSIAKKITDTGSYTWTIPEGLSTNYLGSMYITVTRDNANSSGLSEKFTLVKSSSTAKFTSPSSMGSKWKAGETYEVKWTVGSSTSSSNIVNELGLIAVDSTSVDSAASLLVWGPKSLTNETSYKFTVPKDLKTGYYRFILNYGSSYVKSEKFYIVNENKAPAVSISVDDSSILSGKSTTLKWESENATSCSLEMGDSGKGEVVGLKGTKTISPKVTTNYKIMCNGAGGTSYVKTTVFVNSLDTTSMKVYSPAKDTKWYAGKTYEIKWNVLPSVSSSLAAEKVKITISPQTCFGTNLIACTMMYYEPYVIAKEAPNTGSYKWTVPNTTTADVVNAYNYFGQEQITVTVNGTEKSSSSDVFYVSKTMETDPPMCDYPAPPAGCSYVKGSNYNGETGCGKVLSCSSSNSLGCTSNTIFSPITGLRCAPSTSNLPIGCTSTLGYSYITGAKCSQ